VCVCLIFEDLLWIRWVASACESVRPRPSHAAYSNRAACRTKLGSFAAAILDAEWCIALDPAWSKGYARKGLAELLTQEYAAARPGVRYQISS